MEALRFPTTGTIHLKYHHRPRSVDRTPSRDSSTNKGFKKRKFKTLFITVLVIHLLNIFRISFLIFFNFKGIPFDFVHQSLFFISAIVGALFFAYLLHKWLPELFISIYYIYPLMTQKRLNSIEKIQIEK